MSSFTYDISKGLILINPDNVLEEYNQLFRDIYGDDFVTDPSTQQGKFIAIFADEAIKNGGQNIEIANQLNPNYSTGVWLDATANRFFLSRSPAISSRVVLKCQGVPGTIINAGSLVADDSNINWRLVDDAQIQVNGLVEAIFECTQSGAIGAGVNKINNIKTAVLGWETATNEKEPSLGQEQQSDLSLSNERIQALGNQSISTTEALRAALSRIEGVETGDFSFRANNENTPQTIDGIAMNGNSVFICVDGGTEIDVATAIKSAIQDGASYNSQITGMVTEVVTDPISGQQEPISFKRSTKKEISVRISVQLGSANVDGDSIKEAVINYFQGKVENYPGITINKSVYPQTIGAAVTKQLLITVAKTEIKLKSGDASTYSQDVFNVAVAEKAITTLTDIDVVFL